MAPSMIQYFNSLLHNSDLDLSQSVVLNDNESRFIVRSRITPVRIALSLLFAVPCLYMLFFSLRQQGFFLILPAIFCPPLAILAVLFGMVIQEKALTSSGQGFKSWQLLNIRKEVAVALEKEGVIVTYKKWSQGEGRGCYFYHAEIKDLEGFGFCIARDEKKRDAFAKDLAEFLSYEIHDLGETYEK